MPFVTHDCLTDQGRTYWHCLTNRELIIKRLAPSAPVTPVAWSIFCISFVVGRIGDAKRRTSTTKKEKKPEGFASCLCLSFSLAVLSRLCTSRIYMRTAASIGQHVVSVLSLSLRHHRRVYRTRDLLSRFHQVLSPPAEHGTELNGESHSSAHSRECHQVSEARVTNPGSIFYVFNIPDDTVNTRRRSTANSSKVCREDERARFGRIVRHCPLLDSSNVRLVRTRTARSGQISWSSIQISSNQTTV